MQSSTETSYKPCAQTGDVDKDGEVVDRLRDAGVDDDQLDAVLLLLAAGAELQAARARAEGWAA